MQHDFFALMMGARSGFLGIPEMGKHGHRDRGCDPGKDRTVIYAVAVVIDDNRDFPQRSPFRGPDFGPEPRNVDFRQEYGFNNNDTEKEHNEVVFKGIPRA